MKYPRSATRTDLIGIALILVCSPVFALMQNYDSPLLFHTTLEAAAVSIPLGALFVFPYTLYLLAKYIRLLFKRRPVAQIA